LRYRLPAALLIAPLAVACKSEERATPPPAEAPAKEVALANAVVMIGVGDIAVCGTRGDENTAALVDSVLRVDSAAGVETVVATFGDNVYPVGSRTDFARCFAPSWGGRRIMNAIRPSPGNHDYATLVGAPYYRYFGQRAGPPGVGYYSYDIGEWHAIALNSEIMVGPWFTPRAAKAQMDWLRNDLKSHSNKCTVAYFHRPLFSSGVHGGTGDVQPLWNIMYEGGVDLILNGHEHHYERFLPQTPLGVRDDAKGIEQIIAGTGGGDLRGLRSQLGRNSAAQIHGHFGVLKLTLGADEYRHAFIDTSGRIWDSGGRQCH
jgi:calcineurin-like phosphoesterase family protein